VSHSHAHHDEEVNAYYLDQLFSIGVCGLLGGVAIMLWWPSGPDGTNRLRFILAPQFHAWVLGGGIVLLLLVAIRAWALWVSVGEENRARAKGDSHDHDHDHDHCHEHAATCCAHGAQHDHAHEHAVSPEPAALTQPGSPELAMADHGHSHSHGHQGAQQAAADDHGHEHGWSPWRYVVLLLPVVLFFLDLPNAALSMSSEDLSVKVVTDDVKRTEGDTKVYSNIGFTQLEAAATFPEARGNYAGKYVRLTGIYDGSDERQFTLSRYKVNCCVADAVPLRAVIVVDYSQLKDQNYQPLQPSKLQKQWVNVTGQVQFLKKKDSNEYMTALIVTPTPEKPLSELVEVLQRPPANPYLN
jgi:hypothetical protein